MGIKQLRLSQCCEGLIQPDLGDCEVGGVAVGAICARAR